MPMDANRLAALACDTKRRLDWDRILVMRDSATGEATPWKWVENARNFAIYTKTERDVHAVLAVGTIKASANEIAALLTAGTTQEYARKMAALHGHDFKDAAHQYDVEPLAPGIKSPSTGKDTSPTALSVRSLTFGKPSGGCRRASHDVWYHLHAEYEDRSAGHVEHILTTLRAQDASRLEKPQSANITFFRDGAIAGYRIDEQSKSSSHHRPLRNKRSRVASKSCRNKGVRQQSSSRVHFYAEVPQFSEPTSSRGVCSERTTMQRLVQVAKNCHRLSLLIRRRRLGAQALVGRTRFLPPTNTSCSCCSTRVLVAKVCRVCGQGVCRDCSDKYERETYGSIETVRVCDPCLERVESCAYSSLRANAVSPMAVDDPLTTLSSSVLSSSLTVL